MYIYFEQTMYVCFFFCEKKNLTSSKLLDMSSERSGLMTLRVGAGASSSSSLVRDVSTEIIENVVLVILLNSIILF